MSLFSRMMRWMVCGLLISMCFALGHPLRGNAQGIAASNKTPSIASEFLNFTQVPFNQFPKITCPAPQQSPVPLNCTPGSPVAADKLLLVGNFTNFGFTKTSLQSIANVNNLNLNQVGADNLLKFYGLITPNMLLGDKSGGVYRNQKLDEMPLVKDALFQNVMTQYNLGNSQPLQQLQALLFKNSGGTFGTGNADFLKSPAVSAKLGQLELSKVVAALPEFGNFSFSKLPKDTFKAYTVANAIPSLVKQPIGNVEGVESLSLWDLAAVQASYLSISQMPNPPSPAPGLRFARFDLPLGQDERDLGRQISGGIVSADGAVQKQNCSGLCKFAELNGSLDPTFNGATWVDGENFVPDGFGVVCGFWPGGCNGPAGNNPFGSNVRVLLTNINARAGTAQVSVTFPLCYDVWFVGRTCTPSVFPISSGIPLYTIREGDWLPFVVPRNFG
jgi:hypothetical protein